MNRQKAENEKIKQGFFKGERPLFAGSDLHIEDTVFAQGESPLKESTDIELDGSIFQWKYPLWYSKNVAVRDCAWQEMARAGVWYTDDITVENSLIEAPKNFRRCHRLSLGHVSMPNAAETLWHCDGVVMNDVTAKGDYFAMNSSNMEIDNFELIGNYSFDGAKNVKISHAKMLSKDAFWNSENVTVYDSFISGEYLGWNAKNLTLINCTVESLQGMCYIEGLVMKNCKLLNTTLAFEYSSVDVDIKGRVDSILNPLSGRICADAIGELIIESERVDEKKTQIICSDIKKRSDHFSISD